MPINKNAQLRYQILDRCLSNFNRKYTFDDLMEEVNDKLYDINGTHVSVRQIRQDMENMTFRPYNAPIQSYPMGFGKKHYYRYTDPDFSIFKSSLSEEEISNLRSTIEMLGRYRGIPSNAWLEEVISNLEYRFGIKSNSENVVEFDQNEQLKGIEFLSDIIDATINHQPLSISYRTYRGKEMTTTVHPYYVKQYNNRWFLFGLESSKEYGNYITNKALDRIVKFKPATKIQFIPNTEFDFKEFFKDIVGVTIPGDHPLPEKVVLKFDEQRFPYIVSKPIHPSQAIIDENEHTIGLYIRPNKELEAQIFSFGPQVEVLEPLWLREQIYEKIVENYKKYSPMQNDCITEK